MASSEFWNKNRPPDHDEAVALLRSCSGDKVKIQHWNDLRNKHPGWSPNLDGANLEGANLQGANLQGAILRAFLQNANLQGAILTGANLVGANLEDANLEGAKLRGAKLRGAHLVGAILEDANFEGANLEGAILTGANLEGAILQHAILRRARLPNAKLQRARLQRANLEDANLRDANLEGANLEGANLRDANLEDANLEGANLEDANLRGADLNRTKWGGAHFRSTTIADVDLRSARNLKEAMHDGPSPVSTSTLVRSHGQIPDAFLKGCGLQDWEILAAELYDPALSPSQVNDLQYKIFEARTTGPLLIGGVFISYAHEDAAFADKLKDRLEKDSVRVWLDRHDATAGRLTKVIADAIRISDIVLIVLSETSVKKDWVKWEIKRAREKEQQENRDVMCPVALDEAWTKKVGPVWDELREYNILDFSASEEDDAFEAQYKKLLKGLKIFYEPKKV